MDDFNKTPNIYPNLNAIPSNEQQFRLNKINEIKDYFLAEIREREVISKNLSKYIAFLDYFDKALNVLFLLSGSIPVASFASVIEAPAEITGANCSPTFSITPGFVKRFLKTIRNKKKKHNKTIMMARSKLNSIENKISKALLGNEISHEDFEKIINEENKYQELKESLRMINIQRRDAEKVNLIEQGKKIGINEAIKHNQIINNNFEIQICISMSKNEIILFIV